ncbi:MAG: 16S rRNA (guanine(527)-N(7))-methyltransferase RsmG [Deltaproteobacteria bacterium]|nr:16S rRNA (guanine(527)-N(7))-methyltransferase RsmG [Deltaproteobacteria bacterium]MBN2688169.1 16S rRNA (guanine(527)-N(7))-methyltransferase RsmG [Deltaproteobacteria bacterium]
MKKGVDNILMEGSRAVGCPLGERECVLFRLYHDELIFWNRKLSLVSRSAPRDLIVKHFIDSLAVVPFIEKTALNLLDIGSGAGFPGLPIKIAMDALQVTLVDGSRKKVSFLKHLIRKLHLSNVSVFNERIETFGNRPFDVVISRASFKLPRFLELGGPFVAPEGTLIAMKGPNAEEELAACRPVAARLGISPPERHDITLPFTGDSRSILLFRK